MNCEKLGYMRLFRKRRDRGGRKDRKEKNKMIALVFRNYLCSDIHNTYKSSSVFWGCERFF